MNSRRAVDGHGDTHRPSLPAPWRCPLSLVVQENLPAPRRMSAGLHLLPVHCLHTAPLHSSCSRREQTNVFQRSGLNVLLQSSLLVVPACTAVFSSLQRHKELQFCTAEAGNRAINFLVSLQALPGWMLP